MPDPYITDEQLQAFGVAPEADGGDVFELLADAVSRQFDREAQVSDGFFNVADEDPVERTFRSNGSTYVFIGAYIADSIETIVVDGEAIDVVDVDDDSDDYYEDDGHIVLTNAPKRGVRIVVSARWGFEAVPDDIKQACIEQGLAMWRKKDRMFADISGVSSAVLTAEMSPTFAAVTKRYRGLYGQIAPFA